MSGRRREDRLRRQAGYTLIELMIATAIGLLVMSALTSVVVTTMIGTNAATGRVETSGQIRNFELFAYDDFALSHPPAPSGCGIAANPCTTQPMVLSGFRMTNQARGQAAGQQLRTPAGGHHDRRPSRSSTPGAQPPSP